MKHFHRSQRRRPIIPTPLRGSFDRFTVAPDGESQVLGWALHLTDFRFRSYNPPVCQPGRAMPIRDPDDAREVESHIEAVFAATSPDERATDLQRLFVETLDFDPASGQVPLRAAPAGVKLPDAAEHIASLDGVHVCYIELDITGTERVRKAEAAAAAKQIAEPLGEDLLLIFTNTSRSQLHFIHPSFEHAQPTLRRMVVERDLRQRTAVQQVANVYWEYARSGSIRAALETAFDVEPVTKRFFEEYRRVFEAAEAQVTGFGEDEDDDKRLFVQTLFNRLMFVYFLSRKRWLTFYGEKDYLNALWEDYRSKPEQANFYDERLYHLFFVGLNNPYSRDENSMGRNMEPVYGDPPFLNGGLFEETELDQRDDITVPDAAVEPVLRELFDRFNFTVMESTPFDIEVAVDPEMLGKVFEELVTGRHESGAFYTPRPVVSFMCREALKGFLEDRDTGLSSEAIEQFVDQRSTSGITTVNAARAISNALDEITVVDPACGSGAYLLGMLQELVELQTVLFNVGVDARGLYELKLDIIERNLYGVDIDEFAVNIAMLRLWLSLAIEFDGPKPDPLPNLDFKIVCGDSLLGPEPVYQLQVMESKLGDLKTQYMHARLSGQKDRLRSLIEAERARVEESLGGAGAPRGSVNWRLDFAEVFETRHGFDLAIANPPYVRQERIGPQKETLVRQYTEAASARSDLYCYFYARALQLLRGGGWHVFVCSNSWLDVGYGAKLQKYLLENAHVYAVYESAVERQFSTAQINTVMSLVRRTSSAGEGVRFVHLREQFEAAIAPGGNRREIVIRQTDLHEASTSGNRFVGGKWGGKYLRAPDIYHHIQEKCADKLLRLGDYARIRRGLTTGANEFFYLDTSQIRKWGIEDRFLRPVMVSPQESRRLRIDLPILPYKVFMCNSAKYELSGTQALEYINWGETQGYNWNSTCSSRKLWYALNPDSTARIACGKMIGDTWHTFASDREIHFNNVLYEIHPVDLDPMSMIAVMNSTIAQLCVNVEGRVNFGGGMLELARYELTDLILPNPYLLSDLDVHLFSGADWKMSPPSAKRREIDEIVFGILDLSVGEQEAIYEGVSILIENRNTRARSV